MLQTIRNYTEGRVAFFIISLIILTFALWGIHNYLTTVSNPDVIATVNDEPISKRQFVNMYERLRRMQQTANMQFDSQEDQLLKRYALQVLIDTEVKKQAAFASGYGVSQKEIEHHILNIGEFQVNGVFSYQRFKQLLSKAALLENEFFNLVKTQLVIDEVKQGILSTSFVLHNELNNIAGLLNQERAIVYLTIPLSRFLPGQVNVVTEEEIKSYYDSRLNDFKIPQSVRVAYIELSFEDVLATLHPTEKEVKAFYERTPSYKKFSFSKIHNEVKEAYLKKQAEEKFLTLKQTLSDRADESTDNLQLIASSMHLPIKTTVFFSKQGNEKEGILAYPVIRQAAFSDNVLKEKNNSDIIQITPNHVVILRVDEVHPARYKSLSSVRTTIKEELGKQKARDAIRIFAIELKNKIMKGERLVFLAQKNGLQWKDIGYVKRSDNTNRSMPFVLDKVFAIPLSRTIPEQSVDANTMRNKANKVKDKKAPAVDSPLGCEVIDMEEASFLICVHAVKTPDHNAILKARRFLEARVSQANGLIEYILYKKSHMHRAAIKVFS